jgi:hypothetical protein
MSFLDVFALIVLSVTLITVIVIIGVLGALPGRIARNRRHPQADAIAVGGWLGLLFGGVLWPLVMIWAYTHSPVSKANNGAEAGKGRGVEA